MEAYVNPEIDYTNLSEIIKKQKEAVKGIVHKFLNVKTTHKFSDLEKILKKSKFDVNIENEEVTNKQEPFIPENLFYKIPGIDCSGWKYEDYENFIKNDNNNINFYTQCRNLVNKIKQIKNAWPFLKPVDPKEVPDYYEVIKEPMGRNNLNHLYNVRCVYTRK